MLNKTSKAVRLATLGALAAGALSVAPVANAEVEVAGSVSIANMYLWRGNDLGNGDAAVSGDIVVSSAGFYGGLWGSSGDSASGTEYDIFVGFGGEAGDFSYDIMAINYMYPSVDDAYDDFAGFSEVILTLGFGPLSFSYYDNVANKGGPEGYEYYTLGFSSGAYSATIGMHDYEEESGAESGDATHLDLSYAYNDNLSFTLSQVVDTPSREFCSDPDNDNVYNSCDDDVKFVVSYSLPIE
jgi:uncharacterized protein (TIGR02001 family)